MKKWIVRIGAVVLIPIVILILGLAWETSDTTELKSHITNTDLTTIKDGWPGTPIDQRDRFINDEFPFLPRRSTFSNGRSAEIRLNSKSKVTPPGTR